MKPWLESLIGARRWHEWAAGAGEAAYKVLFAAVLFFLARWMFLRAIQAVLRPLLARAEREGQSHVARLLTLDGLARSTTTYSLLFLTVVTLLNAIGVPVATLITGAGVAGLALSFGAQRVVRDVLTGAFILIEDQFRVGEVVTLVLGPGLPQLNGTIQEMGLRTTQLLDLSGKHVSVGNGDIVVVINHNRGPVTATVEIGVPPDASLDRLRELATGLALPETLFTGLASIEGVSALDALRMVVRIAAPARPGHAPEAELALRQAFGEALRKAEVEIR
jgi:small conductance mechanosensitive channel